jgi:hypothetical protein
VVFGRLGGRVAVNDVASDFASYVWGDVLCVNGGA